MRASLVLSAVLLLACQRQNTAEAAGAPRQVREPAVAGSFYPDDPKELSATIQKLLAAETRVSKERVKAVLVPHAGYVYSGAIAARSFKQVTPGFERAVVVAGNHTARTPYSGASPDKATHYRVPGAEVKVSPVARALSGKAGFPDVPEAHTSHVIEVELPFLQAANAGKPFELLPLIVGRLTRAEAQSLARELAKLDDGKTLFVFSVDLSHFFTYDEAVAQDRPCLDALARANADDLAATCNTDANQVLLTMLELGARLALTPRLLGYQNSGDVAIGDRDRVVGYGSMVWEDRFELNREEQQALLALARRTLEARVRDGKAPDAPKELFERYPRLTATRGAFVTLKKDGDLRGCIGTLEASERLADDVVQNAINAAVRDSRFKPVAPEELPLIHLSISVLDAPRPFTGVSGEAVAGKLAETKPGLILGFKGRRSTFLPEVWEQLPVATEFLGHLCRKQGSPTECWKEPQARFETYGSQHFEEPPRP